MDLFDRGNEIKSASQALEHALRTRKDIDSHTQKRILDLIAKTKKINARTSETAIHELIRESNELNRLFTIRGSGMRGGGTISGMESQTTAETSRPEGQNEGFVAEFQRIRTEARRIGEELQTASADSVRVLNAQLATLANEQDRLIEQRFPISRGELIDHPEFAQAVREGYARIIAGGALQFSPSSAQGAVDLARLSLEKAGNATDNPWSNVNPLSSSRQEYQLLLNKGVIRDAYAATRRAILDERINQLKSRYPIQPSVAPTTAVPLPAAEKPVAAQPGGLQPVGQAVPEPLSMPAGAPQVPPHQHMSGPATGPQSPAGWGTHPAWMIHPGWTTGPAGYQGAPFSSPAAAPQAPGHSPEAYAKHEKHQHEAHTPVTNEAERQKLRNEYDRLEKEQNDIIAQGLHLADKDGAKARQLFEKMKGLKAEQRKVCLTLFGPQFDSMVQAERERMAKAGPAHPEAPHGHEAQRAQPTAAEGQRGIEGVRNTAASNYAAFVAGKQGLPATEVQRWMSAPKRWARALVDGVFRGAFVSAAGMWGTGLTSMLTTYSTASVFGLALPFTISAPVVLAGVGGALAWSLTRRVLGMHQTDRAVDAGWQANKLRRIMSRHERRGNNPDIERKYARINKWWKKAIRAQNLIPSLLGGVLGGGFMYDVHTGGNIRRSIVEGGRNIYNQGLPGLQNRGLGLWQGISEWFGNLFQGGTRVDPRCKAGDHNSSISAARALIEDYRLRLDDADTRLNAAEDEITRRGLQLVDARARLRNVTNVDFSHDIGIRPDVEGARSLGLLRDEALHEASRRPNTIWTPYPEDQAIPAPQQPAPPPQAPQAPPQQLPDAPPAPSRYARWRGFAENLMVQNPSGGFEALVRSIPGIDISELNFGSGNPSKATDIFRRVMYETPGAWQRFFGEYVRGSGSDAFEYAARRLPTGRSLDYSVLTEKFGSSSTIIDRMIERAQALGRGGEATVEALQSLRDALTQGRNPALVVPIGRIN